MSWDILLMRIPAEFRTLDDIPKNWQPPDLGPKSGVIAGISAVRPDVDWSDPTWGDLEGKGFSIEFNIGKEDPTKSVMLHVRGGGEVIPLIEEFCRRNGWRAIDCSSGELMRFDSSSTKSWESWQAYRDRVIGAAAAPPPGTEQNHE